jgi:hypothetical protein
MGNKQVTVFLNEEEMRGFNAVKKHFSRNSNADTLRFLIGEAKKNLPATMSKGHKANVKER